MPQGHSHETTELKLLFLSEGLRIEDAASDECHCFVFNSIHDPQS